MKKELVISFFNCAAVSGERTISVRGSRRTRYVVRLRALRRFTRTITITVKAVFRTAFRFRTFVRSTFRLYNRPLLVRMGGLRL